MVSAAANSFHRHSGSSSTSRTAGRAAITLSDCGSPRPVRKYLPMHDSSCGMAYGSAAPTWMFWAITWPPYLSPGVEGVGSRSRAAQDPKEAHPVAARAVIAGGDRDASNLRVAGL